MSWLVSDLLSMTGGQLLPASMPHREGDCALLGRVVCSLAVLEPGDLFWDLSVRPPDCAARTHEAFARGAQGVVSEACSLQPWPGKFMVRVPEMALATPRAVAFARSRFYGTCVAVAGEVGKTITAMLCQAVLGREREGLVWSPEIAEPEHALPAVALGLLNLQQRHSYCLFELPSTGLTESAALSLGTLADWLCPHVVIILAPLSPLELERQLATLRALPVGGWAILNGDDAELRAAAPRFLPEGARPLWVGRSADNDLYAEHVTQTEQGLCFIVEQTSYHLPLAGRHHLHAALAALALARILKISDLSISQAFETFTPLDGRCRVLQVGSRTVLDDNATSPPVAMLAALETARDLPSTGRRVVVCGEMATLPEQPEGDYRRIGEAVVTRCGADLLVACGEYGPLVRDAAIAAGMPRKCAVSFDTLEQAMPFVQAKLQPNDVVLVKGAPAAALQRFVHAMSPVG